MHVLIVFSYLCEKPLCKCFNTGIYRFAATIKNKNKIKNLISESESHIYEDDENKSNVQQMYLSKFYACFLNSAGLMRERYNGSFSMTDRPPEEFCLSPEAPSDLLSIDLLHKRSEMMNNQILHRFLWLNAHIFPTFLHDYRYYQLFICSVLCSNMLMVCMDSFVNMIICAVPHRNSKCRKYFKKVEYNSFSVCHWRQNPFCYRKIQSGSLQHCLCFPEGENMTYF